MLSQKVIIQNFLCNLMSSHLKLLKCLEKNSRNKLNDVSSCWFVRTDIFPASI